MASFPRGLNIRIFHCGAIRSIAFWPLANGVPTSGWKHCWNLSPTFWKGCRKPGWSLPAPTTQPLPATWSPWRAASTIARASSFAVPSCSVLGAFALQSVPGGGAQVGSLDVRPILIVDGGEAERFAGRPLGLLDVLGKPRVERVAARLRNFGAEKITILSEREPFAPHFGYPNGIAALHWQHISDDGLWRACEQVFNDNAHEGAEVILVWRLGAYAEVNLEDQVQFHLDSKNRVTPVMDESGWLRSEEHTSELQSPDQ